MQIRINGQLFLLMLVEKLLELGATIKQVNTDGVLYLIDKSKSAQLDEVIKEWEQITKLSMETESFERFYQTAINDYLGICEGYKESHDPKLLKKKGMYIDTVSLGKGMDATIIPEAINKYFADNIPIEKTIKECRDITKFLSYQKVDKKFAVEYNNELIQHINRYYMSTNGYYLYKCVVESDGSRHSYTNINTKSGVIVLNEIKNDFKFPTDINYRYYISEARKIIDAIEIVQLKLF